MATQYNGGQTAGAILTAATMNSIGAAWELWTPALTASTTNPTLGTGSGAGGLYGRVQKLVYGTGSMQFGTTGVNPGNGFYYISLPVTAKNSGQLVGTFQIFDASAGASYFGFLLSDTTSRCLLYYNNPASVVTNAAPWIWAASDFFRITFQYEAA